MDAGVGDPTNKSGRLGCFDLDDEHPDCRFRQREIVGQYVSRLNVLLAGQRAVLPENFHLNLLYLR